MNAANNLKTNEGEIVDLIRYSQIDSPLRVPSVAESSQPSSTEEPTFLPQHSSNPLNQAILEKQIILNISYDSVKISLIDVKKGLIALDRHLENIGEKLSHLEYLANHPPDFRPTYYSSSNGSVPPHDISADWINPNINLLKLDRHEIGYDEKKESSLTVLLENKYIRKALKALTIGAVGVTAIAAIIMSYNLFTRNSYLDTLVQNTQSAPGSVQIDPSYHGQQPTPSSIIEQKPAQTQEPEELPNEPVLTYSLPTHYSIVELRGTPKDIWMDINPKSGFYIVLGEDTMDYLSSKEHPVVYVEWPNGSKLYEVKGNRIYIPESHDLHGNGAYASGVGFMEGDTLMLSASDTMKNFFREYRKNN